MATKTKRTKTAKIEDRHDRFKRIGRARMNRALRAIRLIGNLSNPNYDCDEGEVRMIQDALLYAVNEMVLKFDRKKHKAPPLQFDFEAEETNGRTRSKEDTHSQ